MQLVVDASVVLAVLLEEEPARAAVLAATAGRELYAPASLPYEVGNAVSAGFKRGRITSPVGSQVITGFLRMRIQLEEVDLGESVRIATAHRIYAYDAYMLELALRRRAALATLDQRLCSVARDLAVPILEV